MRELATRLVSTVLRFTPEHCREWTNAMLRELDFIEGDWAALFWALGSVAAIFRRCGSELVLMGFRQEAGMKEVAKSIGWLLLGIVLASALAVGVFGLFHLAANFYPPLLHAGSLPWPTWLLVFFLPETLLILGIVRFWRKRRPMALGILLAAAMLGTHFVMHIMRHWNG